MPLGEATVRIARSAAARSRSSFAVGASTAFYSFFPSPLIPASHCARNSYSPITPCAFPHAAVNEHNGKTEARPLDMSTLMEAYATSR